MMTNLAQRCKNLITPQSKKREELLKKLSLSHQKLLTVYMEELQRDIMLDFLLGMIDAGEITLGDLPVLDIRQTAVESGIDIYEAGVLRLISESDYFMTAIVRVIVALKEELKDRKYDLKLVDYYIVNYDLNIVGCTFKLSHAFDDTDVKWALINVSGNAKPFITASNI